MSAVNTTLSILPRKTTYRRMMLLAAVVGAFIALPATAQAAPITTCDGTIGAVMVEGTILVPDGKTCKLVGTSVGESIRVGKASTLIANGIEVRKPGTVSIQAYGATRIEVTGLSKFVGPGEPEELQPTEVLGSIQAVAGGTVIISDTIVGGAVQLLDNKGAVLITDSFSEGAVDAAKTKGNVTMTDSFLGEGVEISETEGNVTFSGNTSDESDLTIGKTKGHVTVEGNPSLGENFEVSETTGHVRVLDNTINDNAEIAINFGGAVVSGNTVGDGLSLFKITGGPVEFPVPCEPLEPGCVLGFVMDKATLIVVGNTVGDNVSLLETGGADGEVIFTANVVRGTATIDKSTGAVTADDNWLGYEPSQSPEPGAEPEPVDVPELPYGGSLLVSEASEGADVQDNTITTNLDVSENLIGTTVSNNTVDVGITVSKNKGGTEVSLNRAGGSIECKDNNPPATGGGNVAGTSGGGGILKGECASL